jgi:hypothetical protein
VLKKIKRIAACALLVFSFLILNGFNQPKGTNNYEKIRIGSIAAGSTFIQQL